MMSNENKWYESDEEDEYVMNENPIPDLDEKFTENIKKIKHSLYDNIVLLPEVGTKEAQDNNLVKKYINTLNKLYIYSIDAQNGFSNYNLNYFPESSRHIIKDTLEWIKNYFSKNDLKDRVLYTNYIKKSLHDYKFVQDNSFIDK